MELTFFPEDVTSNEELVQKAEQFLRIYHMDDLVEISKNYPKKRRLLIDYAKLAQFDFNMADEFLENPDYYRELFEYAAQRIEIPGAPKDMVIRVGIKNVPSVRKVLIRDLSSEFIGKIIVVEGIVREVTDVMPRIKVAVWACKACGNQVPVVQEGPSLKKPLSCPFCGKRDFELLEEKSKYTDFQKIRIQEPLEYLRGGEQSRHIAIYLEDDLVNRTAPGERILVTGVLRIKKTQGRSTVQDKYVEALFIESVQKEFEELEPSPEELRIIKELASDPDIYNKLVASIAPAIKGHEKVKEAIALQLFGGVKKTLPDGTRIRGNIHILLLGDPGTGKSQMLEYAARLAPKSFYVAGKTVTGAGLTASAERDEFGEGGWVIKAGVLVLASGGLAAIDEFDKIDPKERQALHEAMEQQTVSVAKAGIVTRFKAETSILAAANPKFGRFSDDEPILNQISIEPTILNRFDLMFVIREV
ncbi:MAG: minichromosome maintenance protein MCM, partial [Candidatus Diapherotrites archaeon]|nr:minichromosome maintenance protein MCM [Candidatus Diapherotrites archaeon]